MATNAAQLPQMLWATDREVRRGGAANVLLLATSVSLILLSGHPETTFKCLLLTGAYGHPAVMDRQSSPRRLIRFTDGYLGGLLLVPIQIVPLLEYLSISHTWTASDRSPVNPLFAPIDTIITALVPNFYGTPVDGTYVSMENRYGFVANYFDHIVYLSMATWLLAGRESFGRGGCGSFSAMRCSQLW